MSFQQVFDQDPDLRQAVLEAVTDRILTNREMGIRAEQPLTPEQSRFLLRDESSLVVELDELFAQAESEYEVKQGDNDDALALQIYRLYKGVPA